MIQPEKCVSQATVKKILKSNKTIEWHNQWALSDKGRVMFNFVTTPNRRDPINSLKRREQVVIFRLRTNHIQLNSHLSRITKDHESSCPLCDYREMSTISSLTASHCKNYGCSITLISQTEKTLYIPPHTNWCRQTDTTIRVQDTNVGHKTTFKEFH